MKYKYIALLAISSLIASCDVMDTQPFESYDENMVWDSKATADAFVLNSYSGTITQFIGMSASYESYTPNGIESNLSSLSTFPTEIGIDRYYNSGFGEFGNLRKCNLIIEKAKASPNLTQQQQTELIGEAHFMRGLVYFKQALRQGRFVPIQRVLTENDTEAFATPLTSDVATSYQIIMADFDEALKGIPAESLSGRANLYAVHAFRSRAALQAYAYTKDAKYLDICIESAKAVIDSKKYSLDSNYAKMFTADGAYSKEIILGYYRLAQNTYCSDYNEMIRILPNISNDEVTASQASPNFKASMKVFEGWASYFPTQDLVDQYLVIDQQDGKAKPLYETSQYKKSVSEQIPSSLNVGDFTKIGTMVPDENDMGDNDKGPKLVKYGKVNDDSRINELMYENRDNRFYGTVVYDSCVWMNGELVTTCCQGNLWAGVRAGSGAPQNDSWYTTASGYYWKKGVYDVSPRLYANNPTDYHFVLARLGEMYMNIAEAYLLKGNTSEAVKALNETRIAHGGLPASTATSEKDAWEDYIRERRVEMAYEGGDIYWSYLRWGQYGGYANENEAPGAEIKALNRPVHKIQITKDRKRFFVGQITRNDAWNRNFTTKRYLMPIPQGQIDKRSASGIKDVQNPEW